MRLVITCIVVFASLLLSAHNAFADVLKDHPGYWLGDFQRPGATKIRLGAELFVRADGSAWASIASPDQGVVDIPVLRTETQDDTLVLDAGFAKLALTWQQDHFTGEWEQGGTKTAFQLHQVSEFPKPHRPQTPSAPFPYENEEVAIPSQDGVVLGATLSLPRGITKPNLAVLVGGSGPTTRDAEQHGHKLFAVLADQLTRQGIAVLRYDKRGVARSTGNFSQVVSSDLQTDLLAIIKAMRARKTFDRIGLIGHSEGSEVAAFVTGTHPEQVDFLVSMAGPGLNGRDALLAQDRVWAKDHGADDATADRLMKYVRKWYEIIIAEADAEPRIAALKALRDGLSAKEQALVKKHHMNEGTLSFDWAAQLFVRDILMNDVTPYWRKVRCPVLALNGELDHQVPARENLNGIVAALKAGGNPRFDSALLPSLNHGFQTAKTGKADEYATLAETIAPAAIKRITRFVTQETSSFRKPNQKPSQNRGQ